MSEFVGVEMDPFFLFGMFTKEVLLLNDDGAEMRELFLFNA